MELIDLLIDWLLDRGRLLVSTSPAMHPSQYPHLEPYMVEPALQELRLLM